MRRRCGAAWLGATSPPRQLKIRLMRENPEVCLEVEESETPARWHTVMVHGRFEELDAEAGRDTALAAIVSQGDVALPPSIAPYVDGTEQIIAFRIRPLEKTGRYERDDGFHPAARRM
jgi:uncharacterized protein